MEPMMMGDGDLLGDGILGPETSESVTDPALNTSGIEEQGESAIREALVQQAYGAPNAPRRVVQDEK
jgi:hypothetical protein